MDISHCPLLMKPSVFSDGDLLLDGFIPLYDLNLQPETELFSFLHKPTLRSPESWDWSNYPYVLAFLFAIEEINKDPQLLPNLTLGFNIYNALNIDQKTIENILLWISGGNQAVPNYDCQKQKKSVGIIAGTRREFLANIGSLLELYRIPQVTYGPFDPSLSDKEQFPSLYQMATEDKFLVHGVTHLLQRFDWTWVGFFASTDVKAEQFLEELKAQLEKKDLCVADEILLSSDWIRKAKLVKTPTGCQDNSNVNVSIVYGDADIFNWVHVFMTVCVLSSRVWIWAMESYVDLNKMNIGSHFHGSLSFSPQKREIPGFEHFVKMFNPSKNPEDIYTIKFWLDTFNCSFVGSVCGKLEDCPLNSTLEFMPGDTDLMTMSEPSYIIYNAVYAVARALHDLLLGKTETESTSNANQPALLPWKLHPFLRNIQFINSIGDHIFLDGQRTTSQQYDVLNTVALPGAHGFTSKVGEFVANGPNKQHLIINEEILEWPSDLTKNRILKLIQGAQNSLGISSCENDSNVTDWKTIGIELRIQKHLNGTLKKKQRQERKEQKHNDNEFSNICVSGPATERINILRNPPQSVCTKRCGPGFMKVTNETHTCCFKCAVCPKGEISNKTADAEQCIQCSEQEYSNQERTFCLPKLVTYLDFEDPFGMALACTALCFSVITVVVLWVFVKHQDTPIVKANNRTLSYILLISLLLCFLCSFLFIGRPHPVTCILQQITFGLVFTVALSTVLAKTIVVLLAFKSMKPGRTMRWLLASGASNYVIPICTLVQVVICGIWLGLSPPFIDVDTLSEPRHLLLVCDKGSVTAFYCVLSYLGSLALVSFSLSYFVRNLPDTFNEAKFLTFSMLVFCSVWVTFLPVYHGAQGKLMVALEIFSILASSAGLLVCIFAPKCYIILIRPDKNSLKHLKHKMNPRRNAYS
ncbi:extracellular calcium-sensing receptor-like [Erinaceus europaeus]|uniref:Extracellular calcium-sensing receptor-like n=1 Tax=Erinaceus europaeus TaxID=9365 RepID=A0ABM3WNP1_ERIEU|nr:extracellular calcium-sensing receptor-like [Erinaceus europaeus]